LPEATGSAIRRPPVARLIRAAVAAACTKHTSLVDEH
jgi:hypothetical protein